MFAKFSGVESERTISKLRKRKRKFLCCVHLLHEASVREIRNRATTGKKCTKKHDAHEKFLFC